VQDKLSFRLATISDKKLIQQWWTKPHVVKFWDNSSDMWKNAENYLHGKKDLFDYWIGSLNSYAFSLLLTSEFEKNLPLDNPYATWIDQHGKTMSIDFLIGEENFLGKGYGRTTLMEFSQLLKTEYDATELIIDPAISNTKAVKTYQSAGFNIVDTFTRHSGYFAGVKHYLMVLKL